VSLPSLAVVPADVHAGLTDPDRATAVRGVVSSLWHGLWQAATTTPWIAIGLMVPALALLVCCTRLTVRRG
jgi:hypothetical protein